MKITYIDTNSLFKTSEKEFENLKEAVRYFLEPPTYLYEGKKQYLEERGKLQEQLLTNLIDILTDKRLIDIEELTILFDDKYTFEE